MKRTFKMLLSLAMVACIAFPFAACTTDDPTAVVSTYDVTVVDGTISGTNGWNHESYEENDSVTVIPLSESSERGAFNHWEVDGTSVSTSESYTFTVTDDVTVTAVYDEIVNVVMSSYEVVVVNGSIAESGYNHDVVTEGTSVTVTANDSESGEEDFSHWEVDGTSVSTSESYTFTVTSDVTVTAVYGSNYSVWDGNYSETAPEGYSEDEENQIIHIASASALAYWASMMTNSSDATETTNWKYSTFNWGVCVAGGETADAVTAAYDATNVWTVSIDCNIDLAGYEWTPINNSTYGLNEMIIEGNNHIIKNLYNVAFTSGEYNSATMKAGGFFGNLAGSDITIQNLTFDNAITEVTGTNYNYQNLGIVFGFVNSNTHTTYFGTAQETVLDNVNVVNSKILGSTLTRKVGLLIGRLGVAAEDSSKPKQHLTVKNCTLSNNYMVAADYFGIMVGHIYSSDVDITVRNQHTLDIFNNTIQNNTIVSSYVGSVRTYVGTIGCWNVYDPSLESGTYDQYACVNENGCDYNEMTTVRLCVGFGSASGCPVNTNKAMLNTSLQQIDEGGNYSQTQIFIAADISYSESDLQWLDWEANDDQVIYLVCGATVTGLDLGDNVRYISGERNSNGNLIVTNASGNVIGEWVVEGDNSGYFSAI